MELGKAVLENTGVLFLKGIGEPLVQCFIEGMPTQNGYEVINSVVQPKKIKLLYDWKCKIAEEINKRISYQKVPQRLLISLSFFFCAPLHGNKNAFDAENFVKPVIDGIAKGLYSKEWSKEREGNKIRFNEDDSVFRSVYFERHDVADSLKEKVHITIWGT